MPLDEFFAAEMDLNGEYDWNDSVNWNFGVPQNGSIALVAQDVDDSFTTLDNIPNLSLLELGLDGGTVIVAAATLKVATLDIFDDQIGTILAAGDGGSIYIDDDVSDLNAGEILAAAGGQITFSSLNPTRIDEAIVINGASAGLAGGLVTIDSDDVVGPSITLAGAGATLDLDDVPNGPGVSGSGGIFNLNDSSASISGGSNTVNFLGGAGDVALLDGTGGNWDAVYGSNGRLDVLSAQVSVFGDEDVISTLGNSSVSLYGATSAADSVTGSDDQVILNSAQANITGGSYLIYFNGADDFANLSGTSGNWDAVYGSNGRVTMTTAQASIIGDDDTVNANAGSIVSFYGATSADRFNGSDDQIILNDAYVVIKGEQDVITATAGSFAYLLTTDGNWDAVYGSGITVFVASGDDDDVTAHASVVGGGDAITTEGASTLSLYGTNNNMDSLDDSAGQIILNDAQTSLTGANDVIWEYGASSLNIMGSNGTWDTVYATDGQLALNSGPGGMALASMVGGGNTISTSGVKGLEFYASLSLYATDGDADTVTGSDDLIILNSAQASLTGSDDAIKFAGASSLTVDGVSESLRFASTLGTASITGFDPSDTIHLSTSDWSDFNALMNSNDLTQVDDDTVITFGSSNAVTLVNVKASTLTTTNFVFSNQPYG